MKNIEIKQKAINGSQEGRATICPSWFDGKPSEIEAFVESLTNEWKRIPSSILDSLVAQNFITYARKVG